MSAHALLLWMSARRNGNWQQFRSAVEALHVPERAEEVTSEDDSNGTHGGLPLYQQMRLAFDRLGHAEFFANNYKDGWCIAPPVLSLRQLGQKWTGILCGARSPRMLSNLPIEAKKNSLDLQIEHVQGMPPIITLSGTQNACDRLATTIGIAVQVDTPIAILSCLPAINDHQYRDLSTLPIGRDWLIYRFDPHLLMWKRCQRDEAVTCRFGLFRFSFAYERYFFLTTRGRAWKIPGQIGKYLILRRCNRNIFHYSVDTEELTVPASCRPPLLIDRALTLCTGSLPEFGNATLCYRHVPLSVAITAARLLFQEV